MSLLDRYIARQYLTNIVVLFAILFCFVVAVDASINLERFAENAVELAAEREAERLGLDRPREDFRLGPLATAWVTLRGVFDLWWPRLLQLFNFLLATVLVVAMGFTSSQLVKNREFLAMLSAGQSLYRVSRPIIAVAVLMVGLQAVNQELIIPRVAPLLVRDHGQAGRDRAEVISVPVMPDAKGRLFGADRFDSRANRLDEVVIVDRDPGGLATRVISADTAQWDGSGWRLTGAREVRVRERLRTSAGTQIQAGAGAGAGVGADGLEDAALVAGDASRDLDSAGPDGTAANGAGGVGAGVVLGGEGADIFQTSLNPEEIKLRLFRGYQQSLSINQINQMLSREDLLNPAETARLERFKFGRLGMMISSVLTLMIAMPFFVTREPKPAIVQALKSAPVGMATLIGGVIGSTVEMPGLPAVVSSFIPALILSPLAVATVSSVKT